MKKLAIVGALLIVLLSVSCKNNFEKVILPHTLPIEKFELDYYFKLLNLKVVYLV